ncbi:MAG: DMT family protein, partial [Lentisphaeria bacterium]|nr:DMT family protein [Lentisphaeria bacterium]
FEYMLQVPANRIGHNGHLEVAQLKIMQEVIALGVFVPFSIFYMKETLRWNFLWAALCMAGAVYFIFKK